MRTRRRFLFECSTAVAASALAPMPSFGLPAQAHAKDQSLERMSYSALAAQVNTAFLVRLPPGRAVELTLLKAPLARPSRYAPGRRPPGDAGHEKFSLIFDGPKDALIEPAIHRFEHPRLGWFEMSITQIGACDDQRVRYEAVFNRPVVAASGHGTPT